MIFGKYVCFITMFLFNNTLNTFYMGSHIYIKDYSNSERGNLLPLHGLLFAISSKGSFICTTPDRIAHTTAVVTPAEEHWLDVGNCSMGPPWRIDKTTHRTITEHSYHGATSRSSMKNIQCQRYNNLKNYQYLFYFRSCTTNRTIKVDSVLKTTSSNQT